MMRWVSGVLGLLAFASLILTGCDPSNCRDYVYKLGEYSNLAVCDRTAWQYHMDLTPIDQSSFIVHCTCKPEAQSWNERTGK